MRHSAKIVCLNQAGASKLRPSKSHFALQAASRVYESFDVGWGSSSCTLRWGVSDLIALRPELQWKWDSQI
jgi:hypothetical protein